MRKLRRLDEIHVPAPAPDERFEATIFDRKISFSGLKALLGAADYDKAGDRLGGLAAHSEFEREAARKILSGLTLQRLYDSPLIDDNGCVDDVMRINYDVDQDAFKPFAHLTIGDAKNLILRTDDADEIRRLGDSLTGVMAAAIAKIMDVHELVFAGRKLGVTATARTTIGAPGALSSRLQPNHATDDLSALTLLIYTGLSLGAGDALIGVNPAIDTIENTTRLLRHIDDIRRRTGAPTQICVLSHIRTQLACLENGAPVEIMFQSLAGTARTLEEEFDCDVALLDRACLAMRAHGALGKSVDRFMYFETGQGSEISYGKHNGIDMTTAEALCYGLARRYDPFMVNNVTGFIGPETHRTNIEMILSNLQDHFMGKLLGLPMGMAPCYTLHSEITTEGQQIATELLTAAGASYFMDVYLGVDRMLAYFDTSAHDDQTLREIYEKEPAPEFRDWAIARGIFALDENGRCRRGPDWGNPQIFCSSEAEFAALRDVLPAAYGWENAGPRPANDVSRELRLNLAVAREAIYAELRPERLGDIAFRRVKTRASDKAQHLSDPERGGSLLPESCAGLGPEPYDVQIVVADGLSAEAIHYNASEMLTALTAALAAKKIEVGAPLLVSNRRVRIGEAVCEMLAAKLVVTLIGERPGGDGVACRSMSAYLAYRVGKDTANGRDPARGGNAPPRYEYTVFSNIYEKGLKPDRAARLVADEVERILKHRAAGNRLNQLRDHTA